MTVGGREVAQSQGAGWMPGIADSGGTIGLGELNWRAQGKDSVMLPIAGLTECGNHPRNPRYEGWQLREGGWPIAAIPFRVQWEPLDDKKRAPYSIYGHRDGSLVTRIRQTLQARSMIETSSPVKERVT